MVADPIEVNIDNFIFRQTESHYLATNTYANQFRLKL